MTGYPGLTEEDYATLASLAFGRAVVQYGVTDGYDTVALAGTANLVIALMAVNLLPPGSDEDEFFRVWQDNVISGHANNRAMGLRCEWPEVSRQLVSPSFGLAVVYPPALPGLSLLDVLAEAQRVAYTVAVVRDQVPHRQAAIHSAGQAEHWTLTQSGQLSVLRNLPALTAERVGER